MARNWTDETLNAARKEGDREVDPLVADILLAPDDGALSTVDPDARVGRLGYNFLLDLADVLVESPELMLVKGSTLRGELDEISQVNTMIVDYFDPIPAPKWVDEDKLELATELWENETLLAIAVLYAASLPACYLMQKGVPVLYDTDKLAKHEYIFQRIHETGLMLDAVLDPGGIKVIRDAALDADRHLRRVLNELDPQGGWEWIEGRLKRLAGAPDETVDTERLRKAFEAALAEPKRFLWGKGCVSAKKVRFLHAAMRLMLMQPKHFQAVGDPDTPQSLAEQLSHRLEPWDVNTLGVPINQEDQAFVLLTFAYLIPKGMERWGRKVSREQKEAFLHLWKVIGHIMGIREDLMTDKLDEAQALYERILARNAAPSRAGMLLTDAVMEFLEDYLPHRFGLARRLPASLIIDQLGPAHARMILRPERYQAARGLLARLGYGAAKLGVRVYYRLRDGLLVHIPLVAVSMGSLLHRSAEMLIESWRDAFRRKPFYVPAGEKGWVRMPGASPAYERALMAWRTSVFDTLFAAVASIVFAGFAVAAAAVLAFLLMWVAAACALGIAAAGALVAAYIMRYKLPAVFARRPLLEETPSIALEAEAGSAVP